MLPWSRPHWLLWIALAIVWFSTTQLVPLLEPDEGRYAEIPREMAATGDWVSPRLDGLKYFEKPPLQYWATAALYNTFGVNEWTARAWPSGLSFMCLLLTWAWVRRVYSEQAALAALAVQGSSSLYIIIGHLNLLDGGFTFWLTGTVLAFMRAQLSLQGSRSERNWMLLAWVAAALAVLTKGIVVPVLAGLSLIAYSLVQRDWRSWRRLHILTGVPLLLLIVVPWFVAIARRNPEFLKFFFLHEHFARFLTTVHNRVEPWWYFLPLAILAILPWLTDVRAAFRRAWSEADADRAFKPLRFLLIYTLVILGFFSISQSKLPAYILPMVPALAIVIGWQVSDRTAALRRVAWIGVALAVMVAVGLVIGMRQRPDVPAMWAPIWGAVAVVLAGFAAFYIRASHAHWRNVFVLVAASMLAWQSLMVAYGLSRTSRALVEKIRPEVGPDTILYSIGQYRQAVPPYLGRTLILVNYTGELEFGLQQEPGRNSATLDGFKQRWRSEVDAVAFFEPRVWETLAREGLPGHIIASDRHTLVVRRH